MLLCLIIGGDFTILLQGTAVWLTILGAPEPTTRVARTRVA